MADVAVLFARADSTRPWLSKAQNEGTPPDLAVWLCELARLCAH